MKIQQITIVMKRKKKQKELEWLRARYPRRNNGGARY